MDKFRTFKQAFVLLIGLTVVGCTQPQTQIRTQIDIDAPKDIVWRVFTDFEAYSEWNPYHVRADHAPDQSCTTDLYCVTAGDPMHVFIEKPDGEKLDLEVNILVAEKEQRLHWGGGINGIFKGEHKFILVALQGNRTRLHHDEDFAGFALPFVPLRPDMIEKGYVMMNEAAKNRAENLFGQEQ